jgi:hypothetical protein
LQLSTSLCNVYSNPTTLCRAVRVNAARGGNQPLDQPSGCNPQVAARKWTTYLCTQEADDVLVQLDVLTKSSKELGRVQLQSSKRACQHCYLLPVLPLAENEGAALQ